MKENFQASDIRAERNVQVVLYIENRDQRRGGTETDQNRRLFHRAPKVIF